LRKLEFDLIFCDDVRQEVTNKQILIGVYASDMRVSQVPILVPVALWIRIKNIVVGNHPFSIELKFERSKAVIANIDGEISLVNEGEPANIVVAGLPVNVVESDRIIAKISLDGGALKTIGSLRVQHGAS
jgi:hypothetical protein